MKTKKCLLAVLAMLLAWPVAAMAGTTTEEYDFLTWAPNKTTYDWTPEYGTAVTAASGVEVLPITNAFYGDNVLNGRIALQEGFSIVQAYLGLQLKGGKNKTVSILNLKKGDKVAVELSLAEGFSITSGNVGETTLTSGQEYEMAEDGTFDFRITSGSTYQINKVTITTTTMDEPAVEEPTEQLTYGEAEVYDLKTWAPNKGGYDWAAEYGTAVTATSGVEVLPLTNAFEGNDLNGRLALQSGFTPEANQGLLLKGGKNKTIAILNLKKGDKVAVELSVEGFSITSGNVGATTLTNGQEYVMESDGTFDFLLAESTSYRIQKITITPVVESETPDDPTPDDPTPVDPTPDDPQPGDDAEAQQGTAILLVDGTAGTLNANDQLGNGIALTVSGTSATLVATPLNGFRVESVVIEKTTNPEAVQPATISEAREIAVGNFTELTATEANTYQFSVPDYSVRVLTDFVQTVKKPALSYDPVNHVVTLTDASEEPTQAVHLYYKEDDGAWTEYTEPFVISQDTTVTAKAQAADGFEAEAEAQALKVAALPTISYTAEQEGQNELTISLTAASDAFTADVTVYYTTDGTEPTTESASFTTAKQTISITRNMSVVKAVAVDADGNWSYVAEQAVVYARYLTVANEWTTIYTGETFDVPEGVKAYTVSQVQFTEGEAGTVVLNEQDHIVANTPTILLNEQAGIQTRFRIYSNAEGALKSGTTLAPEFKGTATNLTVTADNAYYVLVENEFLRSTAGTLAAGNCYIELPADSWLAGARSFRMAIVGDVTGVNATLSAAPADGQWYGLNGVRIATPSVKGIYIHNGKKIVIR